jgi:hypothetical protein
MTFHTDDELALLLGLLVHDAIFKTVHMVDEDWEIIEHSGGTGFPHTLS